MERADAQEWSVYRDIGLPHHDFARREFCARASLDGFDALGHCQCDGLCPSYRRAAKHSVCVVLGLWPASCPNLTESLPQA